MSNFCWQYVFFIYTSIRVMIGLVFSAYYKRTDRMLKRLLQMQQVRSERFSAP